MRVLLFLTVLLLEACSSCTFHGPTPDFDFDFDAGSPSWTQRIFGGTDPEPDEVYPYIALNTEWATLKPNETLQLTATIYGSKDKKITWSVQEATGGSITQSGLYTAPVSLGTFHVLATPHLADFDPITVTIEVAEKVPPETWITSGPVSATSSTEVTFAFKATDDVALGRIECSLDGEAWAACSSPTTYTNIISGATHRFEARGVDLYENADPTPAAWSWLDPTLRATQISAGENHTCAILTTGGLACWGGNTSGELGDLTRDSRASPAAVRDLAGGVVSISAAEGNTCAVTAAGGVKCWGNNGSGYYLSFPWRSSTPEYVSGVTTGIAQVSLGGDVACARNVGGALLCWGTIWNGDRFTTQQTPIGISGAYSGIASVSSGKRHACVLTTAGGVKCWGDNYYGQLGDGDSLNRDYFVGVSGLNADVVAIASGDYHSCALTISGGVKCWGNGNSGQLGRESWANTSVPIDVTGLSSGVAAITAGTYLTCALTTAGAVLCWGSGYGAPGDGPYVFHRTPEAIPGLGSGVSSISTGFLHTCVIMLSGEARCWGQNSYGQIGLGPMENPPSAVTLPTGVHGFH